MSLNNVPVGDAIAAFVQSAKPPDGTAISNSQLQFIWEGIMGLIYTDLKANMGVLAGTFVVSGVQAGGSTLPVTGTGGPAEIAVGVDHRSAAANRQ